MEGSRGTQLGGGVFGRVSVYVGYVMRGYYIVTLPVLLKWILLFCICKTSLLALNLMLTIKGF